MITSVYSHPACLKHNPGPDRSYAPARLISVIEALQTDTFKSLHWRSAPPATRDHLRLVHTQKHIDFVLQSLEKDEQRAVDSETFAVHGTAEAVLRATGLVVQAVTDVVSGHMRKAFCIVSPGGHHAEAELAQGYCFFNHAAVAAAVAQKSLGQKRIAVLDFDTHHGNGTQNMFWNDMNLLFVSAHEETPNSGLSTERGAWDNILNIPLAHGSDGAVFRQAIGTQALPKIENFKPDLLLVSAGFDMHRDDPLGKLNLTAEDFGWMGEQLKICTDKMCGGRLVAVLEGGYNFDALGPSAAYFVEGMMDK